MKLHSLILLTALYSLISPIYAAEQGTPLFTLEVHDFAQTRQRLDNSIYKTIWLHPLLSEVRKKINETIHHAEQHNKVNPLTAYQHLEQARISLIDIDHTDSFLPKPKTHMQIKVGAYADTIYKIASQHFKEQAQKEEPQYTSVITANKHLARYDDTLVFSSEPDPEAIDIDDADIAHDINLSLNFEALKKMLPNAQQDTPTIEHKIFDLLGTSPVIYKLEIIKHGIKESISIEDRSDAKCTPVNTAVFNLLPKDTLLVAASHINGSAILSTLLEIVGPTELPVIGQIIASLNGTVTLAILPSAPFPSINIFIPRGDQTDALINKGLNQLDITPPLPGKAVTLPIPDLPILVQLGHNQDHWIISTDTMRISDFLNKTQSTFSEGPLAKLIEQSQQEHCLTLGAINTASMIHVAQQFLPMFPISADYKIKITDLIQIIISKSKPGYMRIIQKGGRWVFYHEGLIGIPIATNIFNFLMFSSLEAEHHAAPAPQVIPNP